MSEYPYRFAWDRQGRKGQSCKVTARSLRGGGRKNFNSILVVFEDGYAMVTSGNSIRKRRVT